MLFPGFVGGSYRSQSGTVDSERTVNMYVEPMKSQGATTQAALMPTPGVSLIADAGSGPGRAHFFESDHEYAVVGATFIEVSSAGVVTELGTVALDENPATICSNGDGGGQIFVTSGGYGYIYDVTAETFTQISALDGICDIGGHLDGYFLCLDRSTSTLYISDILDGTSWSTGTEFAQRSAQSDPWSSMRVAGRYVWLLGEKTSEVWYNSGSASFPFEPHQSGHIPFGIAAAYSTSITGQDILWLGTTADGNLQAIRAQGFSPETVSDNTNQTIWSEYSTVSDAVSYVYSESGHTFWVITFPNARSTWAYDLSIGSQANGWAERGQWYPNEGVYYDHRARWHAYAFGKHRVLDSLSGGIYEQAVSYTTDFDGGYVRRCRRAHVPSKDNRRIFYSSFELDLEPGLGLTTGQGSDPQVMMRFSNDGGKTWSSERWRSAGKRGKFGHRVRWTRLGAGRRRMYEIAMSDPIPWRIANAYLEISQTDTDKMQQQGAA
jgi:hypothetical protein